MDEKRFEDKWWEQLRWHNFTTSTYKLQVPGGWLIRFTDHQGTSLRFVPFPPEAGK